MILCPDIAFIFLRSHTIVNLMSKVKMSWAVFPTYCGRMHWPGEHRLWGWKR